MLPLARSFPRSGFPSKISHLRPRRCCLLLRCLLNPACYLIPCCACLVVERFYCCPLLQLCYCRLQQLLVLHPHHHHQLLLRLLHLLCCQGQVQRLLLFVCGPCLPAAPPC